MRCKIISSLEKCFLDESFASKPELTTASMLQNEIYSFQLCYDCEELVDMCETVHFHIDSPLAPYIRLYRVQSIPSQLPIYRENYDDNYLRTTAGLYPDLLQPMELTERLFAHNVLNALWLELDPNGQVEAGTYPIHCSFTDLDSGNVVAETSLTVEILGASLPEQTLIMSQWFHTDCLMNYYGTQAFDEKHWQIIEKFMVAARKYGVNMILTPVLTPPLDTVIGGERATTQLVDITLENGKYTFDFSRLGRWVDLCNKVGFQYLEINPLFTQWGATACPKVIATVDGEEKRIFGWDVPSDSDSYKEFLSALLPQMLSYLKNKNGWDKRCYFHLSDEPTKEQLEQYQKVSNIVAPLLEGYPVVDCMSDYSFYENGVSKGPVVGTDHLEPFLENNVPNLFAYTCCSQSVDVSNHFFAMSSARNRILGVQLYKYDLAGFSTWGYNFYSSRRSLKSINPFYCSDGDCWVPSGDAYLVYPGPNGEPWPSLRQLVFNECLQDIRALRLCEQLYGREYTLALLEEGIEPITFKKYPKDADYLLNLRRKVNDAIARKIG